MTEKGGAGGLPLQKRIKVAKKGGAGQHSAKSVLAKFLVDVSQSKVREGTPTFWGRRPQKVGLRAPKARGFRKMLSFFGKNPSISSVLTKNFGQNFG